VLDSAIFERHGGWVSPQREPGYRRTRFEGSGQPGPETLRCQDGHVQPYKVEREIDFDAELDLANVNHNWE
jgi:hypothetical protein